VLLPSPGRTAGRLAPQEFASALEPGAGPHFSGHVLRWRCSLPQSMTIWLTSFRKYPFNAFRYRKLRKFVLKNCFIWKNIFEQVSKSVNKIKRFAHSANCICGLTMQQLALY
jgi:hypothetical protein